MSTPDLLQRRPEIVRAEVHHSIVSRMGGWKSASIWVTFAAIGGYVGKIRPSICYFELFKSTMIHDKKDEPCIVELYGPDNKLLLRLELPEN